MSKRTYKPLEEPITRREVETIIDSRRFDAAVRRGEIEPVGKGGSGGKTSPSLYNQSEVRILAQEAAASLADEAKDLKAAAKEIAKHPSPLTRNNIAAIIGKKLTGRLIRSIAITPTGRVMDTQTAAHTFDQKQVAGAVEVVASATAAEAKLLRDSAKTRIPA